MESDNGLPNLENFVYNIGQMPVSPFSFLSASTSYSDSPIVDLKENLQKGPESINYHHRCSSESFLIEEQPSWLDDLLNESEPLSLRSHHRRSASDSYAYLGEAAETFAVRQKSKFEDLFVGSPRSGNQLVASKDLDSTSNTTRKNSFDQKSNQESDPIEQVKEESSLKKLEGSAERANASKVKSAASKAEAKRAKQYNAHRSRVRKLQYIAHLERTVQILQTETSESSAELEFIEQQNVILNMENRALRQRLESVSQEQMIKHWEQEMLEREIGRLQSLYHLQKQQMQLQNHQQQQPQNQHLKPRRNKSRDFDHQANGFPMKNKDAVSNKASANSSSWT